MNDDQKLIDAIKQAHDALSRAIAYFQQKSNEHTNGN